MFKARRSRPRKRVPFRYVFVFAFIAFIGMTVWGLVIVNKGIKPTLMDIAQTRATQIATYAVNIAVGKKEIREMQDEMNQAGPNGGKNQLFVYQYDKNNDITAISYNSVAINQFNNRVVNDVQEYLRLIEDGKTPISNPALGEIKMDSQKGLVDRVPIGQATNNVLLSNLGPKIPIRFQVLSNIQTDVKRQVESLSINNVYVRIYLKVTVEVQVVIPFQMKTVKVSTNVPVAEQLIPGQVPIYWGGGSSSGPSVLVPNDKSTSK
ncbi:sporulation protein YunB [Pullulanibacillus sp. KACC 23026]|uniref:sporulation protein YunB n=1 Tax=Pullulanibacillus sp. KACC 23026 TaxID=3028315 RepID=UPI0023B0EEE6|nr:sporulation protein YunB [Pullulanibacillus sp. KACC 23026]WEG13771.1 sporulation protein YunB [Pullulanibacillus sp. KACC 23026]